MLVPQSQIIMYEYCCTQEQRVRSLDNKKTVLRPTYSISLSQRTRRQRRLVTLT